MAGSRVVVEHITGRAGPLVLLRVDLCPLRLIEPEEALCYNATAEHGALVARGHVLALRRCLPLDEATEGMLELAVQALAEEGARLRRLYLRATTPATVLGATFAHLCE